MHPPILHARNVRSCLHPVPMSTLGTVDFGLRCALLLAVPAVRRECQRPRGVTWSV